MDYKTTDKAERDKKQTILSLNGCSPNPHKYAIKEDESDLDTIVLCPFCLNSNPLWKFDKIFGLRTCPFCKNRMRQETLTKNMSIEEFAKWVFDYRLSGFFGKIYPDFKTWNEKLYLLGMSHSFWEKYKQLRGDSKDGTEEPENSE